MHPPLPPTQMQDPRSNHSTPRTHNPRFRVGGRPCIVHLASLLSNTASREDDSTMNGRGVAASGSVAVSNDRNLRQRSASCLIGMED
jgi:hypothetical protein